MNDPGLYSPAVIKAYNSALAASPAPSVVNIEGHGSATVELDGKREGSTLRTSAGVHVVVVSRPGYATWAALIDSAPGSSTRTIGLQRLEPGDRIRALRRALDRDEVSLLEAGSEISDAVDARRLLLFSSSSGQVAVQRYDRATNTLSSAGPATEATIKTLLGPSLQPQVVIADPESGAPQTGPSTSWLERNQTPVLVGGGVLLVAAAVVATVLLTRDGGVSGVRLDSFCGFGVSCE